MPEIVSFVAPKYEEQFAKQKFPNKVALIDADRYKHTVPYRVYQKLQEGKEHSKELVEEVIIDYLFNDIFSKFECKAYIFCFSTQSHKVFRNHVCQEKPYKGNRKGKADLYDYEQKWEDYAYVYEYINKRYTTLLFDDLEADDILSMLQHPERTFIFSHDKDLKQVVGFHYNKEKGFLEYTTEDEGIRLLIRQILKGDTTDNIPGLHLFGDKALEKFDEETKGLNHFQLVQFAMKKFTDKMGVLHGVDCFVEMWNLVSMRIKRGKHVEEKYADAFALIDSLTKVKIND